MLADALRYPLNRDGWLRPVLIGGLLTVLSPLLFPVFFLQGYYARVLRGATNDDPAPPRFDDWVDLLVDGLRFLVVNVLVAVAVLAVVALVGVVFGSGSLLAGAIGQSDGGAVAGALGAVGTAVVVAASLAVGYVAPAALANFAREDSIAAAVDVSTILAGAATVEYLVGWVLAVVVGTVLGFAASLLSLLLVGIFGLFYVQVATYYLFGRGFAEGVAAADDRDGAPAATPR